ncbi:hypothetical protein K438DRAFT_1849566, partial [Mycena galopus ATCC 62051]
MRRCFAPCRCITHLIRTSPPPSTPQPARRRVAHALSSTARKPFPLDVSPTPRPHARNFRCSH